MFRLPEFIMQVEPGAGKIGGVAAIFSPSLGGVAAIFSPSLGHLTESDRVWQVRLENFVHALSHLRNRNVDFVDVRGVGVNCAAEINGFHVTFQVVDIVRPADRV
jgi:hypothetical protein